MLHGMTVCPNALTLDPNVLTVVYICFIKNSAKAVKLQCLLNFNNQFIAFYYSTIMSVYHIRSREQAKYEAVIHRSVLV